MIEFYVDTNSRGSPFPHYWEFFLQERADKWIQKELSNWRALLILIKASAFHLDSKLFSWLLNLSDQALLAIRSIYSFFRRQQP